MQKGRQPFPDRIRKIDILQLGIAVNCDGASNVTDDNLEHPSKTELPRVETEEGTVKEVRLSQKKGA
jgi:hypothetical protein